MYFIQTFQYYWRPASIASYILFFANRPTWFLKALEHLIGIWFSHTFPIISSESDRRPKEQPHWENQIGCKIDQRCVTLLKCRARPPRICLRKKLRIQVKLAEKLTIRLNGISVYSLLGSYSRKGIYKRSTLSSSKPE